MRGTVRLEVFGNRRTTLEKEESDRVAQVLAKDTIMVFDGRRERGKVAKVEVGEEEEKAPRWANEGTDASPLSSTMNPARCSTPTQLGLIFGFCA